MSAKQRCPAVADLWQGARPATMRCLLETGHDGEHKARRDVHGTIEEHGIRIEAELVELVFWPAS